MSSYDALSRWYDLLAEGSEGKLRRRAAEMLRLVPGDRVLEIGCGTGRGLTMLSDMVGAGEVIGVDLSAGMVRQAQQRVLRIAAKSTIGIVRADGLTLPFSSGYFNVGFLSFTLELFEEDQRAALLGEIRRVLSPGGRLGVVALAVGKNGMMERAYNWAHHRFPRMIDCRPIPVEDEIRQFCWQITNTDHYVMWGLPVTVLVATNYDGSKKIGV